ncbi:hypothetical protein FIV42_28350 [Persicimonas caeni]|uniref:Uncharacterized protein n=1 Tax=Persicimonas caeni TaxID=2292766 RepID=A0A4Y6Q1P7_PERCE|nr:hypothetical protein [Persicimonas caeni]QDG54514.1 hypothetical protein FIV42_28350 [Persicimonas caeni]QED35735.1 hypothetical protein FRD00_28345 [Persicimonas caeni]
MLHEQISKATNGISSVPANQITATRSVDQILARRQARLRERKQVFPPDFLHGEAQLDEIYEVFSECWVEQAIFVEEFRDDDGDLVAWTAAWFDDRFLNVEQAVRDEVDDLEGRLDDLIGARRSVVRLCLDAPKSARDEKGLAVRCSLGRLLELEQTRLAVVRDKEFSDPRAVYSQRDDVLQDSRTSILSTICLCARLAR